MLSGPRGFRGSEGGFLFGQELFFGLLQGLSGGELGGGDVDRLSGLLFEQRPVFLREIAELLECRKVFQSAEAEEFEELRRCPVDQGPARLVLASEDLHQAAVSKHLE